MTKIDAAELARLRGLSAAYVGCPNAFSNGTVLALIDALEKARGEIAADRRDQARDLAAYAELEGHIAHADAYHAAMERAEGERDALRARVAKLEGDLERAQAWITKALDEPTTEERDALRVRVKELEEVIQTQNGVIVSGTLKLNEARAERDAARAALEKARGERTTPSQSDRLWRHQVEITEAQRDSARALLRRSRPFLGDFSPETDPTLLSDIAAELEPKP